MLNQAGSPARTTRQPRRDAERRAAKALQCQAHRPPGPYHDRMRFTDLNKEAYANVFRRLVGYGNKLSTNHKHGLLFQAGILTLKAQGKLPGRHQITLAPGVGKTEGVIAWVQALIEQGHDHVGVAIAASKVEELCVIKRKLLAAGVPAERVGLRHEYKHDPWLAQAFLDGDGAPLTEGFASEPSEGHDRQILLVTHARIMRSKVDTYRLYRNGQPRMVIYDEALVKSKAVAIPLPEIEIALTVLEKRHGSTLTPGAREAQTFLQSCLRALLGAHLRGEIGAAGQTVRLPQAVPSVLESYRAALPPDANLAPLRTLLEIARHDLRVVDSNGTGGVVTYEIVIPDILDNVAILDASYPVRDLVQRDQGTVPAEDSPVVRQAFSGLIDLGATDLSRIKRYDNVTLKQMRIAGGRTSMEKHFQAAPREARREDNKVCLEIADTVAGIPSDQSVLIFTFKDRNGVRFQAQIAEAFHRARIDTQATIQVSLPGGRSETRRRISILTWGQETAINDYGHCDHVILAGVIRRNRLELQGAILGQEDSIQGEVSSQAVNAADLGEVQHSIFQALNRGACRMMEDGQARPMTGWIMHKHVNIREGLSVVMPGARWERWKPIHFESYEGSIEETAEKIAAALSEDPYPLTSPKKDSLLGSISGCGRVSFKRLRAALGLGKKDPGGVPDSTWRAARRLADQRLFPAWDVVGQCYVRNSAERYGFATG